MSGARTLSQKPTKVSYTVPCASAFREAVEAVAAKYNSNPADLARSVAIMLPTDAIRALPDPGGPPPGDREDVVRKSGPSAGETWKRKPRLQVRMGPGLDPPTIRRMLGLVLALDAGDASLGVDYGALNLGASSARDQVDALEQEIERLRGQIATLSFEPLNAGVESRPDALYVLGLKPHTRPPIETVRARFRALAAIHHPDNATGDHQRMTQLNEAFALLRSLDQGT